MREYLDFNREHMKELEDENNAEFQDEQTKFEQEYSDMIMKMLVNKKGGKKKNKTRKIRKH
jgi:hypothetical protein